ncbi:MAG TPA: thiopurine S-methyltransferase [Rhodanobacteraceae bacterium]|nr:thiopurine S-methyltransferase [Rhodanobacteraceae bacterium]
MEPEYWLKRWQEGRTGWHHDKPMPLLVEHWPALDVPRGARVLVPLCGKSQDMLWLACQGIRVLGVELSGIAIESFLAENGLRVDMHSGEGGTRYEIANPPGGGIEIIHGDIFGVDRATLASCRAIYDRAALIALPTPVRRNYARDIYGGLPDGCRGLLVTLDYPPEQMEGPPFPVDDKEVRHLLEAGWDIERFERRDILASQPHFSEQGVTALHTAVYRLDKHRR